MTKQKKTYVLVPEDNILSKSQRRRRNRRRNRSHPPHAHHPHHPQNQSESYYSSNPPPDSGIPSFREYQQAMYEKYLDEYYPPVKTHHVYYTNEPTNETINEPTNNPYYINEKPIFTYPPNYLNDKKPYYSSSVYKASDGLEKDPVNISIDKPSYLDSSYKSKYTTAKDLYDETLYDYEKSLDDLKKKYGLSSSTSKYSSSLDWLDRHRAINDELDELNLRQTQLLNELNKKSLEQDDLYQKEKKYKEPPIYYTSFSSYKKEQDETKSPKDGESNETREPDGNEENSEREGGKKKDLCFCLPLDNSNLKKPDTTDGLLHILFPSLKPKESGEDTENAEKQESKRRDRSKFIHGEPIEVEIKTLDDLISLADRIGTDYDLEKTYSLDLESLQLMKPSLEKLNNMVGLLDIKNKIVHQILFYLQGLDDTNKDMLHTVIEGDPGVGKTEIAKILGEIYGSLGILSKGTFQSVKRADLIGSYLGQTASKTLKVLEEAKGGVLFIDEAYSLGNEEGKDIYSKECIDTITAFLSENRDDFVCIIAGYRDALRQCFFKYNAGLERRFPWTYTIKSYTEEELKLIFEKMVKDSDWKSEVELKFFKDNIKKFKHFGGDMENLFHKSKLAHSFRALKLPPEEKKIIIMDDLNYGMKLFVQDEEEKKVMNLGLMYT